MWDDAVAVAEFLNAVIIPNRASKESLRPTSVITVPHRALQLATAVTSRHALCRLIRALLYAARGRRITESSISPDELHLTATADEVIIKIADIGARKHVLFSSQIPDIDISDVLDCVCSAEMQALFRDGVSLFIMISEDPEDRDAISLRVPQSFTISCFAFPQRSFLSQEPEDYSPLSWSLPRTKASARCEKHFRDRFSRFRTSKNLSFSMFSSMRMDMYIHRIPGQVCSVSCLNHFSSVAKLVCNCLNWRSERRTTLSQM